MPDVVLHGCRAEPLSGYLKALAVVRLVGEQKDKDARGYWQGEHFVLCSKLSKDALTFFFQHAWCPTPIVSPWNGGSGFYPKDNQAAISAIDASASPRLALYANAIRTARALLERHGLHERPVGVEKGKLLAAIRANMSDEALIWLDAAVVLGDKPLYSPLLGTGGNDGRLEFSNNFMQRVLAVLHSSDDAWLRASLFDVAASSTYKGTMGQYLPSSGEKTNPWDFIFAMEGAMLFAGAATKRLENVVGATMAFPFHARAAAGASSLTESDENESRDEIWLPLWPAPASLRELRRMLSEGRAKIGQGSNARPARTSLDFARAVTSLGVDRGIASFARVGFHVRNGLAYFATPLGRFATADVAAARRLDEIDAWFERVRRAAGDDRAPATVKRACRRVENAIFAVVSGQGLHWVLMALGQLEERLASASSFAERKQLKPIPRLDSGWWDDVDDGSVEFRLAASLASRPNIRRRIASVTANAFDRTNNIDVVFKQRPLVGNLHALLWRDELDEMEADKDNSGRVAPRTSSAFSWSDLSAFVGAQVDDARIEIWLRGLVLLKGNATPLRYYEQSGPLPPAAYAVLALVHGRVLRSARLTQDTDELHRTSGLLTRACAGDIEGSTRLAIRRLNASGRRLPHPITSLTEPPTRARRIAAALAFPLSNKQRCDLEGMVLPKLSSNKIKSINSERN